jgi:tRNA isopentenyl-2-thiomethyl-A-37 hydroxylase MiaE
MTPNNRMERGVTHKVLRRGLDSSQRKIFIRARVREALACARSCERWAALAPRKR